MRGVTRVGWCDFSLLGDGGAVSWVAGGLGGFTMNFGVFVDGKSGRGDVQSSLAVEKQMVRG